MDERCDHPGNGRRPACGTDRSSTDATGSLPADTVRVVSDEPEAAPPGPGDRDRDPGGRARNARPRDALGRPLPYDATGEERAPEGVIREPARALDEAQRLLDAGRPFHAHEVLEDAWKLAPETERQLWRGLAQLAVGLTHAARGNARGAANLLRRGAGNIAPYSGAPPYGIDVAGLVSWAHAHAHALAADADAGSALHVSPHPLRTRAE